MKNEDMTSFQLISSAEVLPLSCFLKIFLCPTLAPFGVTRIGIMFTK